MTLLFFYLIASLVTFTNSLTSNQSRFYRPYKLTVLSVDIYAYNDLEILRYDLWPCANEHRPCSTYDVCVVSHESVIVLMISRHYYLVKFYVIGQCIVLPLFVHHHCRLVVHICLHYCVLSS